jgi:hypothetical protein
VLWLLKHSEVLNAWEMSFLSTLPPQLSPKQQAKLDDIERKVRAFIQSKEFSNAAAS